MARLKFNRGLRASIDKINTNKTATEGGLYFATDDGTLWYGTASGTLTQVRDNIDHNTTYTSLKNPYSLTLQGNGTTLANGTYDGSSAKTVNITPASIGASASGHKHDAGDITSGTLPVARGGTGQTNLDNVTVGKSKESITYHFSAGTSNNNLKWVKLGTLTSNGDDSGTIIDVFTGNGYNGGSYQNSYVRIFIKDGSQSTPSATSAFGVTVDYGPQNTNTNFKVKVLASSATVCDVWINVPWGYANGSYRVTGYYNKWANSGAGQSAEPTSGTVQEVSYATIAKTSDIPTSLPASDVSSWAKASTKPSYSASEISGLGNLATKSTNGSTANFLRGDGTWVTPSYPSVSNATITIKQAGKTDQTFTLNGGATTISLNDNNTWTALKGATTSAAGTAGYAPAPSAGAANRYLRSDGTWAVPPDNDTHKTWGLSISGHTVSIVDGGTTKSVTVPDNDHTYTLASLGGITPSEVDSKISTAVASAYKYKGSCTSDKLPTTGQVTGDVWNITNDSTYGKAGMNVAWNGTAWDALGSNVDLSNYALKSSIPSVSNATITIKQTGKADQTFTLNGGATTISLNDNNTTYTSLKNPYSLTIQGNGTTLTNGTYDGSAAKTVNITPSSIGAAPSNMVVVSSTQPDASTCKLWIKA